MFQPVDLSFGFFQVRLDTRRKLLVVDLFAIFGIALVSCFSAEYKSLISSSNKSLIVANSLTACSLF